MCHNKNLKYLSDHEESSRVSLFVKFVEAFQYSARKQDRPQRRYPYRELFLNKSSFDRFNSGIMIIKFIMKPVIQLYNHIFNIIKEENLY